MRREDLYLQDIIQAADDIDKFLKNKTHEFFLSDDILRSAVLQKLMIIGEAASRLSTGLRERHPDIPWSRIVAFRNLAIHAYFAVDWDIVWQAATKDAPELRDYVSRILAEEYPEQ